MNSPALNSRNSIKCGWTPTEVGPCSGHILPCVDRLRPKLDPTSAKFGIHPGNAGAAQISAASQMPPQADGSPSLHHGPSSRKCPQGEAAERHRVGGSPWVARGHMLALHTLRALQKHTGATTSTTTTRFGPLRWPMVRGRRVGPDTRVRPPVGGPSATTTKPTEGMHTHTHTTMLAGHTLWAPNRGMHEEYVPGHTRAAQEDMEPEPCVPQTGAPAMGKF